MQYVRFESALGSATVPIRSSQTLRRRRSGSELGAVGNINYPCDDSFSDEQRWSRPREVARLFQRMRSELMAIQEDFVSGVSVRVVRQNIFFEMIIAGEFICEELDLLIARLCVEGNEAQIRGDQESLNVICRQAPLYASLRKRIEELRRELESMAECASQSSLNSEVSFSLNFDPTADSSEGINCVNMFLQSLHEAVAGIAVVASIALEKSDYKNLTELSACNMQLTNFLSDAEKLVGEIAEMAE